MGHLNQVGDASNGLQLCRLPEPLGQQRGIKPLPLLVHCQQVPVQLLVGVHVKVVEGDKSRIQVFEGDVIARRSGDGLRATFTVRKTSSGVGVERTFPLHSPNVDRIELVRHGRVRRAKIYYLRGLRGKKARIRERRVR